MENKNKGLNQFKKWAGNNKGIIISVLVTAVLIFGAYRLRKQIIVATVNGTPIYRWDLVKELETQGGSSVLDSLVTEELIKQEAGKKGVQVTDAEVNASIEELKKSFTEQGQDLDVLLEQQNISQEEFKEQIEFEVKLEKLIGDIEITDEEVNETYENQKDMFGEDISEEEAKASIRQQLKSEKQNTAIQELINTLKENANISKLLNF